MPNSIVRIPGGKVLGFACMVELKDGTRQIVWSDDVEQATFEFLMDVVSIESQEEILEARTVNPRYKAIMEGVHFNITRGPQSIKEVMELEDKRINQEQLED